MAFGGLAALAATTVNLGTAASFAVLAGTTVTNTGSSTISGDLGVDPGSAVTGAPLVEAPYSTFVADSVALGAQTDLTTAYNQAAGEAPTSTSEPVDLSGLTLNPGVYQSPSDGSLTINGPQPLTLSGAGVYIFQTGASQSLVTSTTGSVAYIDGASPCDVFWQIGSSATLNGPTFVGTVMAATSITVGSGVTVDGRVLASTGDVTLISDTINASACITTASLPTPTATATAAATATVPTSGAGGTSSFGGAGVLVTVGGLVLLGAGAAMGVIRRRRFPSV
jgi:type VI secretion system secreted protein VgrG